MARTRNARRLKQTSIQKPIKLIQQQQKDSEDGYNKDQVLTLDRKNGNTDVISNLEDIESELDEVDRLIVSSDLEKSKDICIRVLNKDHKNLRALESLGLVEVELGNIKSAIKNFNKCIEISKNLASDPSKDGGLVEDVSPTIYLYLAQLSNSPIKSLNHFQSALNILKSKLESIKALDPSIQIDNETCNTKDKEDRSGGRIVANGQKLKVISSEEFQIRRSCSRALVGMTEIYLTDLCFEPEAEKKCLSYLEMASELDPTDPEPLQTLASVRISQSNIEEATKALRLALSLWSNDPVANLDADENDSKMEVVEEIAEGLVDDEDRQMIDAERDMKEESNGLVIEDDQDESSSLPPFETRVQWAKLALECDMWSDAIEVLYGCEAENDEDGEVQYLLGMAWYLLGQSRNDLKSEKTTEDSHLAAERVGSGICDGLDKIECWMESKECFDTCLHLQDILGEDSGLDQSILNHIKELSLEFQKFGLSTTAGPKEDFPGPNSAEDDGFEDVSDSSMES
ncbi:hypothetical protein BY996DRAFT_8428529 [Phakopsora pachyrhizi]|uniref:Uncharacterized protein n=1 Tax=Phakopsora pachyrhizi TaxID=170000 RepID=A0AAV0BSP7_PHAPC|nr:hypothetical protein BY996DRAFT_8428529 [Phakopsora pachyrhizi]CAH7689842.1 hypothetical protein PPACK8108_LOCUS24989 [Phakopsora pachyrhizi]